MQIRIFKMTVNIYIVATCLPNLVYYVYTKNFNIVYPTCLLGLFNRIFALENYLLNILHVQCLLLFVCENIL